MFGYLGLSREDFSVYFESTLQKSMPQNITVLAVDDNCICGLFLNNVNDVKHTSEWKEPKIKEDYGQGISFLF
jgi:hypothetical protein